MPRPVPTPVLHFTHVANLSALVVEGLHGDAYIVASGVAVVDIGMPTIKAARRQRTVPIPPHGVVADYVPFYFAPRSPMMSSIHHGNVPQYQDGCDSLVYLVSTAERLVELELAVVATDRNASLAIASFEPVGDEWGDDIDWQLMRATWWNNTPQEPDRRERRMAECLAYGMVPWAAIDEVVAKIEGTADAARAVIAAAGLSTPVSVRPDWYF